MAYCITVCMQKGGVGKTTLTINLAACMARQGKKVLVVNKRKLLFGEMDEQAFSAVIVLIGLIPIHSKHRENGNQLQTLSEHIRNRNIVRVFVIGV